MKVSFIINRVLSRSVSNKNPDFSTAYCLITSSFESTEAAIPMYIAFRSTLDIQPGSSDVAVTGNVRVKSGKLNIFVESVAKRKTS